MNDLRTFESPVATPDGLDRRSFVKAVTMAAAAVGLNATAAAKMVEAAVAGVKPSVIWLHFQECTGCTESLLRTAHPTLAKLILDLISLDYHETLMAAAGHQAEAALQDGDEGATRASTCCVDRGRHPDQGRRHLLQDRRPDRHRHRSRSARPKAGGGHRHRLLRLLGRHALRRPEPDRRHRRADGAQGKTGGDDPRLPAQPLQLPRHGAAFPRPSASCPTLDELGRPKFAYGRLDPRALRAPRPLRRRPLRQRVRRRGPPPGLLPLQARLQGPGDLRQLLDASTSARSARRLAGRPAAIPASAAPSRRSASACRCTTPSTIERPTPPDTYPPASTRRRARIGPVATGVAGLGGGRGARRAATWPPKKLADERRPSRRKPSRR